MNGQRALSERQASACENAENPRCRCRCGGLLHGARRGLVTNLPPSDPHYPAPKDEQDQLPPQEELPL